MCSNRGLCTRPTCSCRSSTPHQRAYRRCPGAGPAQGPPPLALHVHWHVGSFKGHDVILLLQTAPDFGDSFCKRPPSAEPEPGSRTGVSGFAGETAAQELSCKTRVPCTETRHGLSLLGTKGSSAPRTSAPPTSCTRRCSTPSSRSCRSFELPT